MASLAVDVAFSVFHGRRGCGAPARVRDLPLASVTLTMAHWSGGGPKRRQLHGYRGRPLVVSFSGGWQSCLPFVFFRFLSFG